MNVHEAKDVVQNRTFSLWRYLTTITTEDPPISCLLLLTFATGNTKYKFENELNEMNSGEF